MQSPVKDSHGERLVIDQMLNVSVAQAANVSANTNQNRSANGLVKSLHNNKRARSIDDEVLDPTYCPDRPDTPPVQAKRGRGRPRKEKPAGLEEVQAQLTELLQKQASERIRFQNELDAQREQLNELRKAMPRPQVIVIDEDDPAIPTMKREIDGLEVERNLPSHRVETRCSSRAQLPETTSDPRPVLDHPRGSMEHPSQASSSVKLEPEDADIYDASPSPVRNMVADEEPVHSASRVQISVGHSLPEITRTTITLYDGMRMPAVIERLHPVEIMAVPQRNSYKTFSKTFLRKFFGGRPGPALGRVRHEGIQSRPYRILSPKEGPLLPTRIGKHGTRICCDEPRASPYLSFDLFIGLDHTGYVYLGTYRNPLRQELIGCNEITYVPGRVKTHWAEQLVKTANKSEETVGALTSHWPKVKVGWLQPDSNTLAPCESGNRGSGQLVSRKITHEEALKITAKEVLEAFEKTGDSGKPSLSLFYEYFECLGYDEALFEKLIMMSRPRRKAKAIIRKQKKLAKMREDPRSP